MYRRFLLLLLLSPITLTAQEYSLAKVYAKLEIKNDSFRIASMDPKIIALRNRLYNEFKSANNPKENLSFQFIDAQTGFAYGNVVGYGVWTFLYKTTDGGNSWTKLFFEERQYGDALMKDNFFMFDNNRGILIQRHWKGLQLLEKPKNKSYYLLTKDGGITWKKKSCKLKTKNIRYENHDNL